jgi:hypothetical protein
MACIHGVKAINPTIRQYNMMEGDFPQKQGIFSTYLGTKDFTNEQTLKSVN